MIGRTDINLFTCSTEPATDAIKWLSRLYVPWPLQQILKCHLHTYWKQIVAVIDLRVRKWPHKTRIWANIISRMDQLFSWYSPFIYRQLYMRWYRSTCDYNRHCCNILIYHFWYNYKNFVLYKITITFLLVRQWTIIVYFKLQNWNVLPSLQLIIVDCQILPPKRVFIPKMEHFIE